MRARLAESGRGRDRRAGLAVGGDLELAVLADRGLVDVAGEDQLRARVDEGRQYVQPPGDGPLPRAPRGSGQMMVEHDGAQRARLGFGEQPRRPCELLRADASGLVTPRPDRVQADDVEV